MMPRHSQMFGRLLCEEVRPGTCRGSAVLSNACQGSLAGGPASPAALGNVRELLAFRAQQSGMLGHPQCTERSVG